MGVLIPQVVTESSASGAQVIDGSLTLQRANANYLTRAIGTEGNRRTWTYSCWIKRDAFPAAARQLWGQVATAGASATGAWQLYYAANEALEIHTYSLTHLKTNAVYRDTGWYHVVQTLDTTSGTADNRVRLYINGVEQTSFATRNNPNQNLELGVNTVGNMVIGTADNAKSTYYIDAKMAQCYFIDGQALGPENFGYTDPLTNTWRPKKYNIGAENNSNNGTTWDSTNTTAYDGGVQTDAVSGTSKFTGVNGNFTSTLSSSVIVRKSLRLQMYASTASFDTYCDIQVNGSGEQTVTVHESQGNQAGIYDLNFTGTLSSIKVTAKGGANVGLAQVIVDDYVLINGASDNKFYLPMDGNSPIGHDKSNPNPVNNGTTWSIGTLAGTIEAARPWQLGFDGNLSTFTRPGNGVMASIVFDTPISFSSKFEIKGTLDSGSLGGYEILDGSDSWINVTSSFGNVTSDPTDYPKVNLTSSITSPVKGIRFNGVSASSQPRFTAVYVDDVILIDNMYGNGWTPVNFGGSVALPKATGALPILNTDGGGNVARVGVRTDINYSNLVLALPLVGNKEDVSNSVNSGSTTKTITATNSVASSAVSNFYGGSWYFDGSGDTLTIPNNTDFNFGSGDSTIEMWVYPTRISGTQENIMTRGTSGYSGFIMSVTNFLDTVNGSSWGVNITYDNPLIANAWQHIAVCRSGNTWTVYINGIANGIATASGSVQASAQTLTIGQRTGQTDFQGYMSDIHIYKGAAKYTSNFIPASTSPDILPDTPSGVSSGSKLTKITDGAVSFDGSGDYLSVTGPGTLAASSNWCMECTFYCTGNASGTYRIMSANESAQSSEYILMRIRLGQYQWSTDNANSNPINTAAFDRWTHMAFTKEGTTVRGFIDGKKIWEATDNNTVTITELITGWGYSGEYFPGFISNARFVNGSSVYTADFTPPTAPLTNITNTYLLCCQSNTLAGTAAVVPGASGINDGTPWSEFVTISEGVTGTNYNDDASNAFDGDTSSIASLYSGNMVAPYSRTTVVFTPPSPITVSSGLRVYMGVDRGQNISVNGTQTNASVSAGWNDTGFTGTLTSLTLGPTNLGSSSNPAAFEVDGVILKNLVSPKGNAAANNFNPFNTDINTVRGQETGYATLNPLSTFTGTLSEGNLKFSTSGGWEPTSSTIGVNSGKWFWEYKFEGTNSEVGISAYPNNTGYTGNYAGSYGVGNLGDMYVNGTETPNPYSAFASGSTIGQELDLDNGTFRHYVNGVVQPYVTESLDTSLTWFASGSVYGSSHLTYNFGQKPFKFPPPAGFQPLNAANIRPETVIARPDHYVGATTYSGTGSTKSVTGVGHSPDFLWAKARGHNDYHTLIDSVRGTSKTLYSNATDSEGTDATGVTSFDRDGFSLGANSTAGSVNVSGRSYVAWTWKAGGNKNTFNKDDVGYASAAAAGLTGGSITPTGSSVGTKQGFSIIKYTGNGNAATIPHGLSQTPTFLIKKFVTASSNWDIWTPNIGANNRLIFTDAATSSTTSYQNVNASTFDVHAGNNDNTVTMIAYLWHDVPGLQKFGSFEGNGNADGPFVELGFKPAVIITKNMDNYGTNYDWCIYDNTRSTINPNDKFLCPNLNKQENVRGDGQTDNARYVDFLSNGFKIRNNSSPMNLNAHTIIYAAWAEAPTVNLFGAQSNAR